LILLLISNPTLQLRVNPDFVTIAPTDSEVIDVLFNDFGIDKLCITNVIDDYTTRRLNDGTDGGPIIEEVPSAEQGTCEISQNRLVYVPPGFAAFTGTDQCRYEACEECNDDCTMCTNCDDAFVYITVTDSTPLVSLSYL
jgi:hypothetical protein